MKIKTTDKNTFSFGKLSEPGIVSNSPLSKQNPAYDDFNTQNFQYIVNNIADMFGYAHNSIKATVSIDDISTTNILQKYTAEVSDEMKMRFTMNANINIYERTSTYGKHFMYTYAKEYGTPFLWGVVAHEIGHLVASHAVNVIETRIVDGYPTVVLTASLNNYWSELSADYIAGIVLAKATPSIDRTPLKNSMSQSKGSSTHPSGYLRSLAIEMGYLWGKNNPKSTTDKYISDVKLQKEMLYSFFNTFYTGVYMKLDYRTRSSLTPLPNYFVQPQNYVLGRL